MIRRGKFQLGLITSGDRAEQLSKGHKALSCNGTPILDLTSHQPVVADSVQSFTSQLLLIQLAGGGGGFLENQAGNAGGLAACSHQLMPLLLQSPPPPSLSLYLSSTSVSN